MSIEEIAQQVLEALETQGVNYMIVGSLASNLHGLPRTTIDADIVISCDALSLDRFVESLQNDFYADKDMALDALKTEFMFNVIHFSSGLKVDLMIQKKDQFNFEQFNRRMLVEFLGVKRWVASPEDVILSKLAWYNDGGSERQLLDAASVARVQKINLDNTYLWKWAHELKVEEQLKRILDHINSSDSRTN